VNRTIKILLIIIALGIWANVLEVPTQAQRPGSYMELILRATCLNARATAQNTAFGSDRAMNIGVTCP
jgi:hypothetical protein